MAHRQKTPCVYLLASRRNGTLYIGVTSDLARRISSLLFTTVDASAQAKTEQARKIFRDLQQGKVDRSLFTDNANSYFNEQALKDFAGSLGPLGMPFEFVQTNQALRGGMTLRVYKIKFRQNQELRAWTYEMSGHTNYLLESWNSTRFRRTRLPRLSR